MADEDAGGVVDINEKSQDNNISKQEAVLNDKTNGEKPPPYLHSVSRTSLTFYGSENAKIASKKKLESLKSSYFQGQEKDGVNADEEAALLTFVLGYCVGGGFNIKTRYVIQDPFNILVLLELLDILSPEKQFELLNLLSTLLKQSIKNLQSCTKVGLIAKLLQKLPSFPNESIADKAIDLIGDLATYSITVRELNCFFAALQRTEQMKWPPHAFKLLEILKKMPEKHGPDVYFNFSGKSAASITVPPISKWPHQPGFTFVTWLQLDAAHLSPSEQQHRPHIYSFVNNRGLGYSAHFSGPMLVIQVWGKNGKKQTVLVKSKFEPQMWYHVCISHVYNRFKSSEVKIFVNGQMVTSGDITMPANKDTMDKCFIGRSHTNNNTHVFKGQMSAIYVFSEPMAYNVVIALYRLGPGYKGKFKFRAEVESTIPETDRKLIYEGRLSQTIQFTYNPKAVDGDLCLESSPSENPMCFYHSPHALMMEGVHSVVTHSLQAAMHSLGGIQMLFPLFAQLDCPLEGQAEPEPKICSLLLSLIYDLLRGSSVCQQQMIQSQGFMIIGHLLQKSSPIHLTEKTVDILLGLARYFMATSSAAGLLGGLLDHVLLEPSLWIKTPLALQSNLLSLFATGYVGGLDYAGYIRKEVGVPRLILMLRKYYSIKSPSQQNATSVEEVISLRAFVLLLVKQMIMKEQGILEDELKSILVYLAVEEEEGNYTDILQLLLSVMCETPDLIVPCFDMMEGFHVFFKLLVATDETIRIYSLKILCAYIQQLNVKRKLELVEKYGFISKIGQKLSIFDMTMVTYNGLFELLTARATKMISENRHASPDSSYVMYHPSVLPIIVNLLLRGREECIASGIQEAITKDFEITCIFLSDLVLLLNCNNDNKRLLLQLMCWQDWMFSLAYFDPVTKEEIKVTDNVFSIIKMLLYYAIQNEKEGWRVWVDTLSILHAKVSLTDASTPNTEQTKSPVHIEEPRVIFDDKKPAPEYIDQETGELNDVSNISKSKSNDVSTNIASVTEICESPVIPELDEKKDEKKQPSSAPTSPNLENDPRKLFFEKLKQSATAVSTSLTKTGEDNNEDKESVQDNEGAAECVVETNDNEKDSTDNKIEECQDEAVTNEVDKTVALSQESTSEIEGKAIADAPVTVSDNDKETDVARVDVNKTNEPPEETITNDSKVVAFINNVDKTTELKESTAEDIIEEKKQSAEISENKTELNVENSSNENDQPSPGLSIPVIGNSHSAPVSEQGTADMSSFSDSESAETSKSPEQVKVRPYVDIPEFTWSNAHQRLLTELLFSIETDIQVWKTHTRKVITDFVSSRENSIYIMNLCHMVSILSDSLIYCCGGLLPLLASATSKNFTNDVLEPCGGMTLDAGFSFLNRILNIVDIIAFATSMNFSSVEQHRNMSGGGVLRQCIRLVFCGAARNRVVCRQRERPLTGIGNIHPKTLKETQEAIKTLIASTKPPTDEDPVQNIPGHMTTITNPERLLQDSDINRLRALVYREVEDNRQSQYVALVVIYLVAVLMVARYRDILDHEDVVQPMERSQSVSENSQSQSQSRERSSSESSGGTPTVLTLEEKIDMAFHTSASLLREILFDFSHYLSRVLVGSRGQDLISDGLGSLKSEDSTVELVMLLCSQEWQNALQRQAGTAFMDLVDEGRLLSHSTRERIVITGSEALDIMKDRDNMENLKHAQFETLCTKTMIAYMGQYKTYDQFFKAKKKRNMASATQSLEKIFDVLTSEFGAWPLPEESKHYQYHKMDRWEDMKRRRMRMVKNPFGTSHPEATLRPGSAEVIPPEKPPPLKYHIFTKQIPMETSSDDEDEIELDVTIDEKDAFQHEGSIVLTTDCKVVSPGAVVPGTLAITSDSLYFTADDESEELKTIDPHIVNYNDCLNIKCSFGNIVAVFQRRYILQHNAVEIFLANRRSFMFTFENHDVVKKVIQYLPSVGIGVIYGVPKARGVSNASPRQQFLKCNMLQRWQNRDVSNFEYIMFLNTIAGRTYNDLNQYFIFPWVLQNYETEELDLKDPSNYRDLSKPIGALNPFRLAQFVERYNSWDENGEIPPFHYGTHYSTGGFVMNWLVRMEPFASLFLSLQGGKFDHPLRTFSSIKSAWTNCQRDTSDVKELIPELFYQPEMLTNSNKYIFGDGDEGKNINDVILPAWAKSPEHFIHLHREALESDYVSLNLHKWIDLIFGYKQKGREAEHNANVFYHLTYEGSVHLDSITDSVTREALEEQIKSFGQTPQQLLMTPHPPRNVKKVTEDNEEPHKSIFLSFMVTHEVPITYVSAHTGDKNPLPAIITISCNQVFSVNKWINFGGNITSYQSLKHVQIEQDPSLESLQGRLRRQLGEPLHESVTVTSSCFAVTSDNKCIFTCGYWDKSFKCFSAETGKLIQCIFGHWDVVTCLAYSDDELTAANAIVVSGSSDATILVWIWDHKRHRIIGSEDPSGFGSTPIAICIGHELPVTCVDVNTSIGVIASGSVEGACLVHSLSGELLRCLKGPDICQHPRLVNVSNEGRILVNYSTESGYMAMFSNNGDLVNYVKLTDQILAVVFTKDGAFFVTGGFSRSFHVWRSYDLTLLSIFPPCDGSIRCLALTPDQRCMIAGLTTGSIIAMAMDFSMWPRVQTAPKAGTVPALNAPETTNGQETVDVSNYIVTEKDKESGDQDNKAPAVEVTSVTTNISSEAKVIPEDAIKDASVAQLNVESKTVESIPDVQQESTEEVSTLKTMAESISKQADESNEDASVCEVVPTGEVADSTEVALAEEVVDSTEVVPAGAVVDSIEVAPAGQVNDSIAVAPASESLQSTEVAPTCEAVDATLVTPADEVIDSAEDATSEAVGLKECATTADVIEPSEDTSVVEVIISTEDATGEVVSTEVSPAGEDIDSTEVASVVEVVDMTVVVPVVEVVDATVVAHVEVVDATEDATAEVVDLKECATTADVIEPSEDTSVVEVSISTDDVIATEVVDLVTDLDQDTDTEVNECYSTEVAESIESSVAIEVLDSNHDASGEVTDSIERSKSAEINAIETIETIEAIETKHVNNEQTTVSTEVEVIHEASSVEEKTLPEQAVVDPVPIDGTCTEPSGELAMNGTGEHANSVDEGKHMEELQFEASSTELPEKRVTPLVSPVPDDEIVIEESFHISLKEETNVEDSPPTETESTKTQVTSLLSAVPDDDESNGIPDNSESATLSSDLGDNNSNSIEEVDTTKVKKMESSLTAPVPSDSEDETPSKTILESVSHGHLASEESESQA